MSIPGSNLLVQALGVIKPQQVVYFKFTENTTTGAGRKIPQFEPGVPIPIGSVQTVPRNRYQILGLDVEKNYITWFVPMNVAGTGRDTAGDRITYGGRKYQLSSQNPWVLQDGWMSVIGVDIGSESDA